MSNQSTLNPLQRIAENDHLNGPGSSNWNLTNIKIRQTVLKAINKQMFIYRFAELDEQDNDTETIRPMLPNDRQRRSTSHNQTTNINQ